MKFLLDTHTFIWFINGDPRLSLNARRMIEDLENQRFLSVASVWEIAIKLNTGKLQLGGAFEDVFPRQLELNLIDLLPLELSHLALVATLPMHHRDPFDRLLIAQATVEQLPIIGVDAAFDAYDITRHA